ncbi:MAG: hypothetical protein IT290_02790, partial [Deltaproteobacteria bacterium]|nr:hypothetical protein [Deltaproteobacteria bacterium]
MPELFRRNSLLLTVVGLMIVSGQLMSLSIQHPGLPRAGASFLGAVMSPFELMHHELTASVKRGWDHYIYLQNVETERMELGARVRELESQNSRLTEFEHENKRFKELLNYQERWKLT